MKRLTGGERDVRERMRGVAFLGDRQCELIESPIPEVGYGEVLIQLEAAGICGSDLHVYRGSAAGANPTLMRGHEPCGVVVSLGPGARRLRLGDRVMVYQHQGCGVCYTCASGEPVACQNDKKTVGANVSGAFAEYIVAPERFCVPLPKELSVESGAVLACAGSTAYGALRRIDARPGECVAVFGLGPVGLSAVALARGMGLDVVGIDVVDERLELARRLGANRVVNGGSEEVVEAIRRFAAGCGYGSDGVDCAVEASGSSAARDALTRALRRGGRGAFVGVGPNEPVIDPSRVLNRALKLLGSIVFPVGWMWDAARFCAVRRVSLDPVVTERFSLTDAKEAFQVADAGKGGKVIFSFEGD